MGSADLDAFIEAACVPLDAGHGLGTLGEAEGLLAVPSPSGYAEVDELLRASRGRSHLP